MIEASQLLESSLQHGFSFYSGVPCSFLTPVINHTLGRRDLTYIGAASEGEAVGIAVGAHLAGSGSAVMCQNSGLGNTVNPLTSLAYPFRLPILIFVTHRGQPGLEDEPQHELMGRATGDLLELMKIGWRELPTAAEEIAPALEQASETMSSTSLPFAFVVSKGSVRPTSLDPPSRVIPEAGVLERRDAAPADRMTRTEALGAVVGALSGDEAIVSTTGKTSRELFELADRENNFYVVGSMGCAAAIGLGIATCLPSKRVVVIDGDGSALMKLGTMATIGHESPQNLVHVILDNEAHDSTGGQATASPSTDFASIAAACRYRRAVSVHQPAGLAEAIGEAAHLPGPHAIHVKISPGSPPDLGRPAVGPVEVKERFMAFLANHG